MTDDQRLRGMADAVLVKHRPTEEPSALVSLALEVKKYFESNAVAQAADTVLANQLTPCEKEIVVLIAEGLDVRAIATRLSRSEKTVKSHRGSIRRKLKPSVALITRFAIRVGWVVP